MNTHHDDPAAPDPRVETGRELLTRVRPDLLVVAVGELAAPDATRPPMPRPTCLPSTVTT